MALYVLITVLMLIAILVLVALNLGRLRTQTDQINKKSDDNTGLIICVITALDIEVQDPIEAEQQCRQAAKSNEERTKDTQDVYIDNYYIQPEPTPQPQPQPKPEEEPDNGNPPEDRPSCEIKIVNNCI